MQYQLELHQKLLSWVVTSTWTRKVTYLRQCLNLMLKSKKKNKSTWCQNEFVWLFPAVESFLFQIFPEDIHSNRFYTLWSSVSFSLREFWVFRQCSCSMWICGNPAFSAVRKPKTASHSDFHSTTACSETSGLMALCRYKAAAASVPAYVNYHTLSSALQSQCNSVDAAFIQQKCKKVKKKTPLHCLLFS